MVIVLSAFANGCGDAHKADAADVPPAAVVKVQRKSLSSTLEISSEFLPYQEIDVYAKVSGYIQKLYVDWGTHVKQGQLLAVLEIPELQQQLLQDEASVRRADQEVSRAREEQSRAESAYNVAHVTYTRLADVQKSRPELVAQQEIDVAQGKDLEASAGVSSSKDALGRRRTSLAGRQSRARQRQSDVRLRAHDGAVRRSRDANLRLHRRAASRGNFREQRRLRAVPPLAERFAAAGDPRAGTSGAGHQRRPDAGSERFGIAQNVHRKDRRCFPIRSILTTRTMHTEVTVPNANYELVPGMYASVKIPLHTVTNVLTIPVQAVQSTGTGQGTVLVVNSANHLERREVKLGLQIATRRRSALRPQRKRYRRLRRAEPV